MSREHPVVVITGAGPESAGPALSVMASKDASFVTGQYLIVDGGYSIGARTSQQS